MENPARRGKKIFDFRRVLIFLFRLGRRWDDQCIGEI